MTPVILHLDMNSYFASVIQQDNPKYRGKPLGVCEHLGGIIIGASKEAKKWGITTGTPVWEARKIYPKIILTHTTAERFRLYTRRLIKLVSDYTDEVEVYSIDEVFLDITRVCNIRNPKLKDPPPLVSPLEGEGRGGAVDPFKEAVKVALEIKRRMKTEVGDWLTCSIGIAGNKLLAKIGSDLKKPDGIVVILNDELRIMNYEVRQGKILILNKQELYQKLKLIDVPGIGSRMEKRLNQLGIQTLLDLKNYPKNRLVALFGVPGYHLYHLGQLEGSWKPDVHQDEEIKSIGHMYTLPKEYRKAEFFVPVLYKLCEMVGRRLRRKGLEGNTLHCYYYDKHYQGFGGSRKLGDYISDGREIFVQAMEIVEEGRKKGDEFKLIGVTVANLRLYSGQLSLFDHRELTYRLSQALDKINDKYGPFTIIRAPVLAAGKVFRDSVGFGRVKEL